MSANPISDPQWLPLTYDARSDVVHFARLDRQARQKLAFLADHSPTADEPMLSMAGSALRAATISPLPWRFIFHAAFCRSTLLTKAIDQPGLAVGLSEPAILHELAKARHLPTAPATLIAVLDLLSRPGQDKLPVIIKPSNAANALIPAIMAARPDARAVLMAADLPSFLQSIAGKGLMGRRWARHLHLHLSSFIPLDLGWPQNELFELTDLQVAALAWLAQKKQFSQLLAGFPNQRVATLDSTFFNTHRAQTLRSVTAFFGIELAADNAADIAGGPAFQQNSKSGAQFDQAPDSTGTSEINDEEIAMVGQWITQVAAHLGVDLTSARPLT